MSDAPMRSGRRAALATCALSLLLILAGLAAVSAQLATSVASPLPVEQFGPLPPPWLEFGPAGVLIGRVIVEGNCSPMLLDGIDVVMAQSTITSAAFSVVTCDALVPFGT